MASKLNSAAKDKKFGRKSSGFPGEEEELAIKPEEGDD